MKTHPNQRSKKFETWHIYWVSIYVLCRNTTIQTHFIKVHIKITIFNICVLEDEIKYPFNMNINKLGLHPKGVLNATCVDQQPVRKGWSTVH